MVQAGRHFLPSPYQLSLGGKSQHWTQHKRGVLAVREQDMKSGFRTLNRLEDGVNVFGLKNVEMWLLLCLCSSVFRGDIMTRCSFSDPSWVSLSLIKRLVL